MKINEVKYAIKHLIVSAMQKQVTMLKRVCYAFFLNKKEVEIEVFSCNNERLKFLFYKKYKELRYVKYHIHQKKRPKLCYLLAKE